MSHKVTNKEREYVLKVLNETLEYENEEKFEVEYTLMAIVQNIPNVKSFHIEPQGTQKGMFYK